MATYRLEIDDEKWEKFKGTLTKNETINDCIENWIDQRIASAQDSNGPLSESETKAAARQAYIEGYKLGYDVESYGSDTMRLLETRFERWWSREMEGNDGA